MSEHKNNVKRLAIIPADLDKLPMPAFEYIVLKLNTLQDDVEFEFIPVEETSSFLQKLAPSEEFSVDDFKENAFEFIENVEKHIKALSSGYNLRTAIPDRYLLISLSSLDTHWYGLFEDKYSAIFLGDWEDMMAPPSLLEFMITLIIMEGLELVVLEDAVKISHLCTRGCIGDFNPTLKDVRYKILQGFLCADCKSILEENIGPEKTKKWISILSKEWLGHASDQNSPASIVAKLGYDLFITKGISPNLWQKYIIKLREEGIKESIKIIGAVITAAFLVWFGLK